jgi:hypothetical protein
MQQADKEEEAGGGARAEGKELGFAGCLGGDLKEEEGSVVVGCSVTLTGGGLTPPAWSVGEDAKQRAFPRSVKKNRPQSGRERKWTEEDCNPLLFLSFPKIKERKIGRKETSEEGKDLGRFKTVPNNIVNLYVVLE